MSVTITMPALSPTMTEGKLAKWFVKAGDSVRSGDVIAEIETDKAMMEVEALDDGTITALNVAEGEDGIAVGVAIAVLDTGEETTPTPAPSLESNQDADSQKSREEANPASLPSVDAPSAPVAKPAENIISGSYSGAVAPLTVREALRDAMAEEMRRDENVFLMG